MITLIRWTSRSRSGNRSGRWSIVVSSRTYIPSMPAATDWLGRSTSMN